MYILVFELEFEKKNEKDIDLTMHYNQSSKKKIIGIKIAVPYIYASGRCFSMMHYILMYSI
jgi:hypothetical protein